ncbi:putative acyl-CoA (9+3)-desaturase [Helianthus debilis subsp. tardiflorus]
MGLWVIGHECGYQAFSDYTWLNDTIGYILHTGMLAPYFSWIYSHRRHHFNIGSLDHNGSFLPKKKSSLNYFSKLFNPPSGRLLRLVILCTIDWLLYACFNVSGRKYEKFANHFDPKSPVYNDREYSQILVTDVGLIVTSCGLYKLALAQGFTWLVMVYFAPLVMFMGSSWSSLVELVERSFGNNNRVLHHITYTHVAHHFLFTIPHYHAMEETKAIKPILAEYYQFDDTLIIKTMWREATECFFVEGDEAKDKSKGMYWFNTKM